MEAMKRHEYEAEIARLREENRYWQGVATSLQQQIGQLIPQLDPSALLESVKRLVVPDAPVTQPPEMFNQEVEDQIRQMGVDLDWPDLGEGPMPPGFVEAAKREE
jgi:hypothetical protein